MFLELGPYERVKIIHAEVGLGHLCEKFLVVGSGVMAGFASAVKKHPFVKPVFFRAFVGLSTSGWLKPRLDRDRHGKLMQNERGCLAQVPRARRLLALGT